MKKTKYQPKKATPNHLHGELLTHMRKVGFTDLRIAAQRTMTRAERLRDDQGLLDAAEAKRQRKAAKAAALRK